MFESPYEVTLAIRDKIRRKEMFSNLTIKNYVENFGKMEVNVVER